MTTGGFSYALAIFRQDGAALGQFPLEGLLDWEPAIQWTRHAALRAGRGQGWRALGQVQPIWHRRRGAPVLSGFRVEVSARDERIRSGCEFGTTYFADAAQALFAGLVHAGELVDGERITFIAMAIPERETPQQVSRLARRLVVRDDSPDLPVKDGSFTDAIAHADRMGEPVLEDEIPVIAAACVLDDIEALSRRAGAIETGGALVGHIARDSRERQVFVTVTGQIPARHTEASATRLAFTADTWQDIRQQVALRADGDVLLGWWHSHPDGLEHCFSEHDRALHRTVFSAAHSVAIVASRPELDVVVCSAWGWHRGTLARKGLFVRRAAP
jgi:proteasome lid subunit RPN8/RPN11